MKISSDVIDVFKNFVSINPSIYFKPDELNWVKSISPVGNIIALYNIEDKPFPCEFGIADLNQFLPLTVLFNMEEAEIDFKENYMIIHCLDSRIKYYYASLDCFPIFQSMKSPDTYLKKSSFDADIVLTQDNIQKIKKISNVIGIYDMVISVSLGETAKIELRDKNQSTMNELTIDIGCFSGNGSISLNIKNLNVISGDYKCGIINDKFIRLSSNDNKLFYFISASI